MKFGEGCLKLWHWVGTSSLWGNGANSHPAFICKSCLDSSLKLVSLLSVCFCAVWEIDVCVDHIQAPTTGKTATMTAVVRDTRTKTACQNIASVRSLWRRDLQSVVARCNGVAKDNRSQRQSQHPGQRWDRPKFSKRQVAQIRKVACKSCDQPCNRDADFMMR